MRTYASLPVRLPWALIVHDVDRSGDDRLNAASRRGIVGALRDRDRHGGGDESGEGGESLESVHDRGGWSLLGGRSGNVGLSLYRQMREGLKRRTFGVGVGGW